MWRPLLLLLSTVAVALGQDPYLEVEPTTIRKGLGDPIYVNCQAKVENFESLTEMKWIAPDGRQIPDPDVVGISTIDGGPGALGLYITKLEAKDTGTYVCSAVYAGNRNLETSIDVNSFEPISFGDTPLHQTPTVGSDALIRCTVTSNPSPSVDWLRDGTYLRTDERHIIQQDGVLITNIQESDEGVYTCRARVSELGSIDQRAIRVQVLVPPQISEAPVDTSGVEKETVTFQCGAEGKPQPVVSWVDGESMPLQDQEGYFVDDRSGELTILNLRPEQAGTYRCTATNAAGSVTSEAHLQVLTKPKLEQLLNITVHEGSNAELRCVFSGDPLPSIIFQKETNSQPFVTGVNEDTRVEVTETVDEYGHRVGVMTITDLARSDDGLYTCTGRSDGGETVGWGHTTVEFAPTFERQATNEFWSLDNAPVNLTCLATSIPNATIAWYLHNEQIPADDPHMRVMSLGPQGILQVTPLAGNYYGTFTCEASNIIGKAQNDVTLKLVHKPGPVANIDLDQKSATTITWALREPVDNGGRPITTFVVEFATEGTPFDQGGSKVWTKGQAYSIEGLLPNTRYNFRFAAENAVGRSEWSGTKTELMNDVGPPLPPLIFASDASVNEAVYTDRYDLQWRAPLDNGSPIDRYLVIYHQVKEGSSEGQWEKLGVKVQKDVPSTPTTFTMKGLRPDAFYQIELRAHNSIGHSEAARMVIHTANATHGTSGTPHTPPTLGAGLLAAIAIITILVAAIVIDIFCFFCKDAGVVASLVHKVGGRDMKESEAMIESAKNGNAEKYTYTDTELKAPVSEASPEEASEANETTPMIAGDGGDKAAILREEEASAAKEGDGQSRDSPV